MAKDRDVIKIGLTWNKRNVICNPVFNAFLVTYLQQQLNWRDTDDMMINKSNRPSSADNYGSINLTRCMSLVGLGFLLGAVCDFLKYDSVIINIKCYPMLPLSFDALCCHLNLGEIVQWTKRCEKFVKSLLNKLNWGLSYMTVFLPSQNDAEKSTLNNREAIKSRKKLLNEECEILKFVLKTSFTPNTTGLHRHVINTFCTTPS